ncbi:MAG: polysaccharide deacetylase family protein [Candidatus Omnitrophota bacterium]|nr:MAG: polysaccharide deacetylase family protein [Candidatus Omnitrophota bacterium]
MIKRVSSKKYLGRRISLTFDDGPDVYYTLKILDILRAFRVKATFFLVGKNAQKHPDIVRRIHVEGHDIGNHTYSHPMSPFFRKERKKIIKEEITKTNKIIKNIIGSRPLLFRPPLAVWDLSAKELVRQAKELRHVPVGWSKSSADWLGIKFIIRHKLLKRAKSDGDILLFHDGAEKTFMKRREATVQMLPEIIKNCRQEKLLPLPLTEILKTK